MIAGTSQIIYVTSLSPGFKCVIEKVTFVPTLELAGGSADQTINVRKAGVAGTVLAALSLLIANKVVGVVSSASVAVADKDTAYLRQDSDAFSIEMAASGTAFTAGTGVLTVWGRSRPQAAN
jgi:hypothetical protein